MSDEERVKIALNSNDATRIRQEFEYIYQKYKGLVSFVASKYLKNIEDIKDIVSETFLSFFNHALDVKSNIQAYLTNSAKYLSLNLLDKRKKELSLVENTNKCYEENYGYKLIISYIDENLNKNEQEVFYLHVIDGYTFKDISHIKRKSENTIKTIYYRAILKLKNIKE
ncbi:MAG: sigma-70 family RNA polymerase sigma factor [Erysipelotrichaceae bacterium]|nr:sigma-70 family RNA polymerase sigma factor [Erysipelotrichaceae bacterium]